MKHKLTLVFLFITISSQAQLSLEHSYTGHWRMNLEKVENDGYKYIGINETTKNAEFYNEDHSLWMSVKTNIPGIATITKLPFYASRNLFNADNKLEFIVLYGDAQYPVAAIYNEDGLLLQQFNNAISYEIKRAGGSWKLLVQTHPVGGSGIIYTDVYSLPGQYTGVSKPGKDAELSSNIYPNPMDDAATISYSLPYGVSTGNIQVYNTNGVLMRSYQVSNQFQNIKVQRGELPPGMYVYKISAQGIDSESRQFIIH